jgi:hypothetical protein
MDIQYTITSINPESDTFTVVYSKEGFSDVELNIPLPQPFEKGFPLNLNDVERAVSMNLPYFKFDNEQDNIDYSFLNRVIGKKRNVIPREKQYLKSGD